MSATVCQVCGCLLPDLARQHRDEYCSVKCAKTDSGVIDRFLSDAPQDRGRTKKRSRLGGDRDLIRGHWKFYTTITGNFPERP
jgi:hypothetical protein